MSQTQLVLDIEVRFNQTKVNRYLTKAVSRIHDCFLFLQAGGCPPEKYGCLLWRTVSSIHSYSLTPEEDEYCVDRLELIIVLSAMDLIENIDRSQVKKLELKNSLAISMYGEMTKSKFEFSH